MTQDNQFKSGFVAIMGKPNVGKSTLLNRLIGQKISITSRRPQTTRHKILGIKSTSQSQTVFVDTPGLHAESANALNRLLNRSARMVVDEVDLILLVVNANRWTPEDDFALKAIQHTKIPVVLIVNKVDLIDDKDKLLPHIEKIQAKRQFEEYIPVSARLGTNIERLEECILKRLPDGDPMYPSDQITDRSERFLAAEIIREKLTRLLAQELPYALTVQIDSFQRDPDLIRMAATIWVERKGQKGIVIGKNGSTLKKVGERARVDMETLFGDKIYLNLWVKIREGWADDERSLASLGYRDE